jgi:hypothetical protein
VRSPLVPGESLSVGFGLVAWSLTVCAASVPRAVRLASDYRLDARGRLYGWRFLVIVATPELFGSCDGSRSAGSGTTDDEA